LQNKSGNHAATWQQKLTPLKQIEVSKEKVNKTKNLEDKMKETVMEQCSLKMLQFV
jgi:hypothetical protein